MAISYELVRDYLDDMGINTRFLTVNDRKYLRGGFEFNDQETGFVIGVKEDGEYLDSVAFWGCLYVASLHHFEPGLVCADNRPATARNWPNYALKNWPTYALDIT